MRRGPCPTCHYIGNRHLCGCIARAIDALEEGNLNLGRQRLHDLVNRARAEEGQRQDHPIRMRVFDSDLPAGGW